MLASAFELTQKVHEIDVYYVYSVFLETCRENKYTENINTCHILVSGPISYFRVMATV